VKHTKVKGEARIACMLLDTAYHQSLKCLFAAYMLAELLVSLLVWLSSNENNSC